jgi:hypothetical protein
MVLPSFDFPRRAGTCDALEVNCTITSKKKVFSRHQYNMKGTDKIGTITIWKEK